MIIVLASKRSFIYIIVPFVLFYYYYQNRLLSKTFPPVYNNNSFVGSKENLYANIDAGKVNARNATITTEQHNQYSSSHNLNDTNGILNRSMQNLNASHVQSVTNVNISDTSSLSEHSNISGGNKGIRNTTSASSFIETSNITNDTSADTASTTSSNKLKKKRWGILMGRSKTSERIKSATLGREKKKEEKTETNVKHRWSTGLPRFHPLPPSISKETMVSIFMFL